MNLPLKTIALLAALTLTACTSTEDKVNDLIERHMNAFVFVEGGSFMMGNPGLGWALGADSYPAHKVTLDSFSIQKYEVTQGDMDLFMEVTGYSSNYELYNQTRDMAADRFSKELPAAVTWDDAMAFCNWIGSSTKTAVDLPTEAQWEYAARSRGKMYRFATETGEAVADINMAPASKLDFINPKSLPHPPGQFPANPLGLYDMSGNVIEWVSDNYQPDFYLYSPEYNPKGPDKGKEHDPTQTSIHPQKVMRGGRFYDFWGNTTVSRMSGPKNLLGLETGFRCVLNP